MARLIEEALRGDAQQLRREGPGSPVRCLTNAPPVRVVGACVGRPGSCWTWLLRPWGHRAFAWPLVVWPVVAGIAANSFPLPPKSKSELPGRRLR